jgi:hypothetical protein
MQQKEFKLNMKKEREEEGEEVSSLQEKRRLWNLRGYTRMHSVENSVW